MKQHFPIFQHHPNLVYLDSAVTALKPQPVIDALSDYYTKYSSNIHRGLYPIAEQASAAYEQSREVVAKFINAPSPTEIIFTRSTTESLNLLAHGLTSHLQPNDTILTTHMEHHANLIPWQELAKHTGAGLRFIPLTNRHPELASGPQTSESSPAYLELTQLPQLIDANTSLVTLTHASNTLGTINDIKHIVQSIKALNPNIKVIVDGAQAIPHLTVDVQDLGCDAYVFSGHKLYGPTGIGILWAKADLLDSLPPFNFGGDMIDRVTFESATYQPAPAKFEAGTPHIAGAIGLAAAINFIQHKRHPEGSTATKDLSPIEKQLHELKHYTQTQLLTIPQLTLYGPTDPHLRTPTFSFTIDGIHPHDLAQILGENNICIRAGHHCTMPLHRDILQVPATSRISLGLYNTHSDIDQAIQAINQAVKLLS